MIAADRPAPLEEARRSREQSYEAGEPRCATWTASTTSLVNSVHRDEMARAQQRMRIEQLEERTWRGSGSTPTDSSATTDPTPGAVLRDDERRRETLNPLRAGGAGEAAPVRRAGAVHARAGQPARAGGVLCDGGAAQVPHRAARGPQADPQGPPRHRPRGRLPGRAGLHQGVRRRGAGLRRAFAGCSRAARADWC